MPQFKRSLAAAMADVIRMADLWATARKPNLQTAEDVELLSAVMRWRAIRARPDSAPPPPVGSAPRFDPEAKTEPRGPGLRKTHE